MSVLTAILLMVAAGTVIHNSTDEPENAADVSTSAPDIVRLVDDRVSLAAGQQASIEVLANDVGLSPGETEIISVVRAPDCGWIAVQGSVLEYLTEESCVGERRIVYTVPAAGPHNTATVNVTVVAPEPKLRGPEQDLATGSAVLPSIGGSGVDESTLAAQPGLDNVTAAGQAENSLVPEPDNRLMAAVLDLVEPVTRSPRMPLLRPSSVVDSDAAKFEPGELAVARVDQPIAPVIDTQALDGLGVALSAFPVDTSQPPLEPAFETEQAAAPKIVPIEQVELARLDPAFGSNTTAVGDAAAPGSRDKVRTRAATPVPNCATPPSTAIDVMRAGRTRLSVVAPCQAGSVAELTYSGIRFALPLDERGTGDIMTMGFEANAQAVLSFVDGTQVDFDIPFKSVDRVSRVALVWDLPVNLELNALEFGALPGSDQHVRPENRRSFQEVRRRGGGFLYSFRSVGGMGQNVDIYSHWKRAGGPNGIVRMMIDFASRNREQLPGTCGEGAFAAPQFLVIRSNGGQLERPILRRLASLDCSEISREYGDNRLISDGIGDLLIQ